MTDIQKIIEKVNFGSLSIFKRDGRFVVVNHYHQTIDYFDSLSLIKSKGVRPCIEAITSINFAWDAGLINVIGFYEKRNRYEYAWLVGRGKGEANIKTIGDVAIETVAAA